ncbi:MAG: adenylate kinase [Candidatus Heimdallarchaeota archaeon]|nr:adenylate kinase [Candidatus Heimdallarchaeota archaeon]
MNNESHIAIVGGIPGVGKTTVINEALKIAREENFDVSIIVYGTVMMEIAEKNYGVKHRDDMRKLPPRAQKEIQRQAALEIAERAKGKVVIVDTHFTIKTGAGSFLQGIPSWVSDAFHPKLLVLIETTAEEIKKRRESDISRARDEDSLDLLMEHQLLNKIVAAAIGQKTGALLLVIPNRQGKATEAGRVLFENLKAMKA